MPEDIPVMIFSDGIEWCKEQKIFQGDRFIFAEGNSTGVDLCLSLYVPIISLLILHSLGGVLGWQRVKKLLHQKWFHGILYKNKDTKDLYIDNWEII